MERFPPQLLMKSSWPSLMHCYIPSSLSSCETHLRVFWRFWYSDNWSSPSLPSPVMPGEEVSILSRPCSKVPPCSKAPPCSTCSTTNLPSLVSWISQTGLAGSTLPASYIIFNIFYFWLQWWQDWPIASWQWLGKNNLLRLWFIPDLSQGSLDHWGVLCNPVDSHLFPDTSSSTCPSSLRLWIHRCLFIHPWSQDTLLPRQQPTLKSF